MLGLISGIFKKLDDKVFLHTVNERIETEGIEVVLSSIVKNSKDDDELLKKLKVLRNVYIRNIDIETGLFLDSLIDGNIKSFKYILDTYYVSDGDSKLSELVILKVLKSGNEDLFNMLKYDYNLHDCLEPFTKVDGVKVLNLRTLLSSIRYSEFSIEHMNTVVVLLEKFREIEDVN